jgi:hypothetical protein
VRTERTAADAAQPVADSDFHLYAIQHANGYPVTDAQPHPDPKRDRDASKHEYAPKYDNTITWLGLVLSVQRYYHAQSG